MGLWGTAHASADNKPKNYPTDEVESLANPENPVDDKTFTIAAGLTKSLVELYEEVDKCQLLCRYCHYEKTRRQWLDGTMYEKVFGKEEV